MVNYFVYNKIYIIPRLTPSWHLIYGYANMNEKQQTSCVSGKKCNSTSLSLLIEMNTCCELLEDQTKHVVV